MYTQEPERLTIKKQTPTAPGGANNILKRIFIVKFCIQYGVLIYQCSAIFCKMKWEYI